MMKELPVIAVSMSVIIFGVSKFMAYNHPQFFILIGLYFVIIVLSGLVLNNRVIREVFKISKIEFEYTFLVLSILILLTGIFLQIFLDRNLGNLDIKMSDYFVILLAGFSISNYNAFMVIHVQRKKGSLDSIISGEDCISRKEK